MKDIILILLLIIVVSLAIFLPYLPGDYDYFAIGLSTIFQFAAFASLLLIPIGLIYCLIDFIKNKKTDTSLKYLVYFRKISLAAAVIIILAAALGAFVSHNRFAAIIILFAGVYIFFKASRKKNNLSNVKTAAHSIIPYYFIFIPLSVFFIRIMFLEKAKNISTNFVIKQSEQLIQDIEAYKTINGHYPISLHSTIEDYKPSLSGIERFNYEPTANAYNLYFEQFSDIPGTQEIVMYNKLGEHEMTVHNQDLLRLTPPNIFRGYHAVIDHPIEHWKIFYFD